MKRILLLVGVLAPLWTHAQLRSDKNYYVTKALNAFKVGAYLNGLHNMQSVLALDPNDLDAKTTYRLQASRYALSIAEDCDLDNGTSHCDSALKYADIAAQLGDSSVRHEIRASALYNKLTGEEAIDFNNYRDNMPERILTKDVCYRYLPEGRRVYFKDLIYKTIAEVRVARGDFDKRQKLKELSSKLRTIDRSTPLVTYE